MSLSGMAERARSEDSWRELSKSECFGLLARERLGRIALLDDGGPVIFPVNYVFDLHMVVYRTDEGTKLDAACRGARVAFEIDGIDAAAGTGWSVLVRGETTEVTDPEELGRLRGLPIAPWAPGARSRYVRVLPAVVTGRQVLVPGRPAERPACGAPSVDDRA